MLLSLTTTHQPATDLGYLLAKHPDRVQHFDLSFGEGIVFYPAASVDNCTVCLLVEVDPVRLVRGGSHGALDQYVNDRPYVASSFLSVAIAKIFRSALGGICKDNPTLASTPLPLSATLATLPCYEGENLLRRLFEPLGYTLEIESHPLDERFPQWENSPYFTIELQQTITLAELLSHLYVLIPVLDAEKHYWIGDEEVEKLLRHGASWLATHPDYELITKRYLKYKSKLVRSALDQLIEQDNSVADPILVEQERVEADFKKPLSLNQERLQTVVKFIKDLGAKKVIDLGCGEGKLLKLLSKETSLIEIVGMDVSYRTLEIAKERLKLERLPEKLQEKIKLFQGSLTYRDTRLSGYDVATAMEVIEHLDEPRLKAFEKVLFKFAQPRYAIVTTPNIEYNVKFANLNNGKLRHLDHRFEWTREAFKTWGNEIASSYGYEVKYYPIGDEDLVVGSPTQMAVFSKE